MCDNSKIVMHIGIDYLFISTVNSYLPLHIHSNYNSYYYCYWWIRCMWSEQLVQNMWKMKTSARIHSNARPSAVIHKNNCVHGNLLVLSKKNKWHHRWTITHTFGFLTGKFQDQLSRWRACQLQQYKIHFIYPDSSSTPDVSHNGLLLDMAE